MSQKLLVKIKDSYVFDKNSKGSHYYIVIKTKSGDIYLQGITHLYTPDGKRMDQLHKGLLHKTYVEGFETPQGLKTEIIKCDVEHNKITMENIDKNLEDPDNPKKRWVDVSDQQKT